MKRGLVNRLSFIVRIMQKGGENMSEQVYKDNFGHDMPCYSWGKNAPWHVRLMNPLYREPVKSI